VAVGVTVLQDPQRRNASRTRRPHSRKRKSSQALERTHSRRHGRRDDPSTQAHSSSHRFKRQTRASSRGGNAVYGNRRVNPRTRAAHPGTPTPQTTRDRSRRTTDQARPATARSTKAHPPAGAIDLKPRPQPETSFEQAAGEELAQVLVGSLSRSRRFLECGRYRLGARLCCQP